MNLLGQYLKYFMIMNLLGQYLIKTTRSARQFKSMVERLAPVEMTIEQGLAPVEVGISLQMQQQGQNQENHSQKWRRFELEITHSIAKVNSFVVKIPTRQ